MKTVKAQQLWYAIIEAQTETGTPYMLYKDACNRKSNHQNLGTIKCSNLCTEVVQYSSPDEVKSYGLFYLDMPCLCGEVSPTLSAPNRMPIFSC